MSREAPLVLVHGSFGHGGDWAPLVGTFARDVVRTPDLPGHGARFAEPPPNFDAAVAALATEVPAGADVVGYSLGGRLALGLARALGRKVRSLVLESAHPGLAEEERAPRVEWDDAGATLLADDPAAFLQAFWASPLFTSFRGHPGFVAERERRLARILRDPSAAAETYRALSPARMPDLWPALAELDQPVLFVSGALDEKYGAIGERVAATCATARHAVVADAGHNVHFERPDEFVAALRDFWGSLA